MVNRHDVPHRVVDVALNLKRLEKLTGDAHEDCAAAAASLITKILVLADDPEAHPFVARMVDSFASDWALTLVFELVQGPC